MDVHPVRAPFARTFAADVANAAGVHPFAADRSRRERRERRERRAANAANVVNAPRTGVRERVDVRGRPRGRGGRLGGLGRRADVRDGVGVRGRPRTPAGVRGRSRTFADVRGRPRAFAGVRGRPRGFSLFQRLI